MNDFKKYKSLLLIIICLTFSIRASTQAKIIFDTDFGGDADDLGVLAMLHNFVDKGSELLSIMCWSVENTLYSALLMLLIVFTIIQISLLVQEKTVIENVSQIRRNMLFPLLKGQGFLI